LRWIIDRLKKLFSSKQDPIDPSDPRYIIAKLYQTIDAVRLSQDERERLELNDTSYTYGEVTQRGLLAMLAVVKPQASDVFYDLGSGVGRAVFCAAFAYGWKKCVGIEYLPGLFEVSRALLPNFLDMDEVKRFYPNKHFPIEFIGDDFLNVDFRDADIIFVNATTLNPVLWGHLEQKFHLLKPGARIIVATRKLDELHFDKIHQALCPMSWGECSVFIYQKKPH
jgi:SAM-dependent methyltransferase